MRPTVGAPPRFEELEKASGFADVASIIEENAFRTAYYNPINTEQEGEEKSGTTPVPKTVCGTVTTSAVVKNSRKAASQLAEDDESVPEESEDTVFRLAPFRACVDRLAATYLACRTHNDHFYFDHRASSVPEHRFAFAHGGWEPIDCDDKDCFECPPTAREALLPPSARTGRP
jgi:hypothetical protein